MFYRYFYTSRKKRWSVGNVARLVETSGSGNSGSRPSGQCSIFVQLVAGGAIYPENGRAVNPPRRPTVNSHTSAWSCHPRSIIVLCIVDRSGGDRGQAPFQGAAVVQRYRGTGHPSKVPSAGHLNSATPMNGLLSKDTPDLSNNELLLICFGKYNTTTNGGKDWRTNHLICVAQENINTGRQNQKSRFNINKKSND